MGISKNKQQRAKPRSPSQPSSSKYSAREEDQEILDDTSYDTSKGKHSNKLRSKKIQSSDTVSRKTSEKESVDDAWSPTSYAAFKLLVSSRFAAALWTTISDCDETYNYWEPTHYLLYGKGFQTWEYSPEYALRSYTYLLIHAVPAKIYDYFLSPNPLLVFFFIRCFLAFISACTEVFLYRSLRKYVGGNICRIALVTSLFAPGMFISSSAFLPSSFSSYMTALAIGAWLEELNELAILAVAVSAILSWPFAALTGLIIAFDIVVLQRKVFLFISWAMISLVVVLVPVVLIDSNHYGKWVIAPLNIVTYNIFSPKGPELYGTEPWTFYIMNLSLNFNIMFGLALVSPILLLLSWKWNIAIKEKFVIISTMFLWFGVFIAQPHKEERFMFPIFPIIPVCGAIGLDSAQRIAEQVYKFCVEIIYTKSQRLALKIIKWDYQMLLGILGFLVILVAGLIGCSRIVALHYGYRAPFDVFFNLHRDASFQKLESDVPGREFTICYGKEWYRFPTSFFLPNAKWNVRFIKSEFQGQLPNLYPPFDPDGTKRIPENMNDLNREEMSRYVPLEDCDFLVDSVDESKTDSANSNEPNYAANTSEWKIISDQDFLNSQKSHPVFRAFYIPFIGSDYTFYDRYVLLERRKKRKSSSTKFRTPRSGREFSDDLEDDF